MHRLALVLALALAGSLHGQDATPKGPEAVLKDGLNEKFGSGSVGDVVKQRGQLRIKTNLPIVNDAAYLKVILESCRLLAGHNALFQDTKEILILNRLEKQGYVFKTAQKCATLAETSEEDAKPLVFSDTKFCNRNCE